MSLQHTLQEGSRLRRLSFWGLVLLVLCACESPPDRNILFIGHAYDWNRGDAIDPRLPHLPLDAFQEVWLGGDVTSQPLDSSVAVTTFEDWLAQKKAHWVHGNHDDRPDDPEWVKHHDGYASFHLDCAHGFCILKLNTNLWTTTPPNGQQDSLFAERQRAQLQYLEDLDWSQLTGQPLFVLHHHGVARALGVPTEAFNINPETYWLGPDSTHTLQNVLMSKLESLQSNGGQVYMVGGDMGIAAKTFEHRLPSGIWLLGSGINNSVLQEYVPYYVSANSPDSVLLLRHEGATGEVSWRFEALRELLDVSAVPEVEPARRFEEF